MSQEQHVVVIGSGLGGLAAACTLAARGHRVTVLEKNETLGGKASQIKESGYRFDVGPTILTLPSVLRRIFAEANRRLEDYIPMVELDPQWRCFFEDGSQLDLVSDNELMKEHLDAFSGSSRVAAGYERFMQISKRLDDVSQRFFFWKSVGSIQDTFDPSNSFNSQVLSDVLSLRMGRTVAGIVRSCIPDERVSQMVDHFTQYVGSSPEASPAVLCGIAHMQTNEGIWYPMGGTRAVPEGLVRLGRELGVEYRTESHVERLLTSHDRVAGVKLTSGETIEAAQVVSNSDVMRTHRELIDGPVRKRFERRRKYEPACSGVVLYLGLKQRYEHILHHNFVFSEDPHEEFDAIYRLGQPAPDPTCYVCAPSLSEPEVAPEGGEAMYVLVHTPYLREHHDWDMMLPQYREIILHKLETTMGLTDLRENIQFETAMTPADIDRKFHVWKGAIYGLASHGRWMGAFKPRNHSPDIEGLYLCGGSAHPGPGMPMVMMSGWIAADTLDQQQSSAGATSVKHRQAA